MTIPASFKSRVAVTHITTATAILDIDGVKFITDPIFDEAPQSHDRSQVIGLKPGEFFLTMQEGPTISIRQLPIIDCVLLSHEDHVDNLDDTGRQLLAGRRVITTPDGAKNLSEYPGTCAIAPWQTSKFRLGGEEWSITGVPCVHVPGGQVTGFLLHKESFGYSPDGRPNVVYFTGDTVFMEDEFRKLREKYYVVVALTNLGQAMLPSPKSPTGFVQITMGGEDAVKMMEILEADMLVPMHFESWTHFTQDGKALEEVFTSGGLGNKVIWLSLGKVVNMI
ncbi:zinc-dependent hydrolase (beta-lactamase superfamily) [Fusarium denticulatum]|uniref:Zinc-dependent hydrolase (Beta-lactamase superfamily) n=1 Tax=Fusarium denticulatum TaxID=48507 RepID=A0A8H5XK60_9HYPO|nr:zinc-dependent hydrolase (beta-lactamase superfamily) [Fusarium denticulatum]